MHNPDLTLYGQMLRLYMMMLDCKSRLAPPTETLFNREAALKTDLTNFDELISWAYELK